MPSRCRSWSKARSNSAKAPMTDNDAVGSQQPTPRKAVRTTDGSGGVVSPDGVPGVGGSAPDRRGFFPGHARRSPLYKGHTRMRPLPIMWRGYGAVDGL